MYYSGVYAISEIPPMIESEIDKQFSKNKTQNTLKKLFFIFIFYFSCIYLKKKIFIFYFLKKGGGCLWLAPNP
jgi:hypothetical protein